MSAVADRDDSPATSCLTHDVALMDAPLSPRNVPGVAMYFYALSAIRGRLSQIPYFAIPILPAPSSRASSFRSNSSALVKLSSEGNLIAGAIGRTSVGLIMSPITILKARYEV